MDKLEERLRRVESSDCGQGGFTTNWYRNPDGPEAADEITRLNAEVERLTGKMRMIVSHATGGDSQDIDESTNDICVRISAMRNHIYADGKERGAASANALIDEMVGRLTEALTPSGATKAAYIGEFSFVIDEQDDEQMCEVTRKVDVPWTTIKEIMEAIRARALILKARGKDANVG